MTTFDHVTLSCESVDSGSHNFWLTDAKQRPIGFKWGINLITSKHYEKGDGPCYPLKFPETTHYRLWTTVTRDGMTFGASGGVFHAVTREEIDTEINRKAEAARIRYTKKFGPVLSK